MVQNNYASVRLKDVSNFLPLNGRVITGIKYKILNGYETIYSNIFLSKLRNVKQLENTN